MPQMIINEQDRSYDFERFKDINFAWWGLGVCALMVVSGYIFG